MLKQKKKVRRERKEEGGEELSPVVLVRHRRGRGRGARQKRDIPLFSFLLEGRGST